MNDRETRCPHKASLGGWAGILARVRPGGVAGAGGPGPCSRPCPHPVLAPSSPTTPHLTEPRKGDITCPMWPLGVLLKARSDTGRLAREGMPRGHYIPPPVGPLETSRRVADERGGAKAVGTVCSAVRSFRRLCSLPLMLEIHSAP